MQKIVRNFKFSKITIQMIILIFLINIVISTTSFATRPPDAYLKIKVINPEIDESVGLYTLKIYYLFEEPYKNSSYNFTYQIVKSGESVIPLGLPPEHMPYQLISTVTKEGFFNSSWTFPSFNKGDILNHTFYLEPLSPILINIFVKGDYNNSIENANIEARAINGNESFSGQTNENGVFSFSAQFVNYKLNITKEGYYDEQTTIVVDHDLSEMDFNVTLYEIPPIYHRMVYLTIKDPDGNPIVGATVNVHTYLYDVNLTNITDENGIAVFELTSDNYLVTVSASEYGTEEFVMWVSNEPTVSEDYFEMGTGMGEPVEPQQPTEKSSFIEENRDLLIIVGVVAVICIAILIVLSKRTRRPKEPSTEEKNK